MLTVQSGIFALGTGSHAYLEFTLHSGVTPIHLAHAIAAVPAPRMATGGLNRVVGFRPRLWRQMAPGSVPHGADDFAQNLQGVDGYTMPATQHDLWVWIAGHTDAQVFDASREASTALAPYAVRADETAGWTYKENRDLTGFIDGTENPDLLEAPGVALVPDGEPGAGGSVVLVQTWIHDSAAWEALSVPEQERMAGAENGVRDALTYHAAVLTGAYDVVPPVEALRTCAAPDNWAGLPRSHDPMRRPPTVVDPPADTGPRASLAATAIHCGRGAARVCLHSVPAPRPGALPRPGLARAPFPRTTRDLPLLGKAIAPGRPSRRA